MEKTDFKDRSIFDEVVNLDSSYEVFMPPQPSICYEKMSRSLDCASKQSERIQKNESRKFGGNPFPWDPEGKEFFKARF